MARKSDQQIVSANALLTGDVVYLSGSGCWVKDLGQAQIARGRQAAAALLDAAGAYPHQVVGPYLVDVTLADDGAPRPTERREILRTTGPSVARRHLGEAG